MAKEKNNEENNKKEPIKKVAYSLADYKAKKQMNVGTKDKPISYISVSPALCEAIGTPGIPEGYVTILRGHSNTSKSTALLECCIGAQRQNTMPIIIDSENSFDWRHARDMGFEFEEKIDENGNPYNDGFFMYINNDYLIEHYGKKRGGPSRDECVVEDVAEFMNNILDDQLAGKLPFNILFAWDSVGTLNCEKGVISKGANNQWAAGALSVAFNSLLNHRIPASRKEGKEFTNTFIAVNKVWLEATSAQPIIRMKGGNSIFYSSRIVLHFGKTISAGTKALKATSKGKTYTFGIETVVTVVKDHVNGVSYSSTLVATPHGFIKSTEVNEYAKKHKDYLLSKLGVSDGDISIEKDNTESDEVDD